MPQAPLSDWVGASLAWGVVFDGGAGSGVFAVHRIVTPSNSFEGCRSRAA